MLRLALALLPCLAFSTSLSAQSLLLTNAFVYTVDPQRSVAEALVIDPEGLIAGVGTHADMRKSFPNAIEVDLEGQMVLPGFHDVHLHAIEAGISSSYCDMPQFGTEDTYAEALEVCYEDWEGGEWIMGAGVNMTNLLGTVADPLALIDDIIPNRPSIIIDDIGHGAWANSLALESAGLDLLTEDPSGGMLIRQADGRLSGVVLESLSQTLVDAARPARDEHFDFAYNSLLSALDELAANGITSVSDAGGYWPRGHERVWTEAERSGDLSVRASNALYVYPDLPLEVQLAELKRRFTNDPDALVRFNQAKIYVDGILTQATGALLAPYSGGLGLGPDENRGFEYFPRDILLRYANDLSAAGFQLHFHTTGDLGARLALDAIELSDPTSGPHRITHLYMIDPADIPRFQELDAVADFQMAPSSLEADYTSFLESYIGDRAHDIQPIRDVLDTGALVVLSSDWDADDLSPLVKLEAVLTHPTQAVPDIATAIELLTINPARLLQHSDKVGSIEVGKFADLAVVDRNLLTLAPERLSDAQVTATLLQGEVTFDPAGLFRP